MSLIMQPKTSLKLHLGVHNVCVYDKINVMDYSRKKTALNVLLGQNPSRDFRSIEHPWKIITWLRC